MSATLQLLAGDEALGCYLLKQLSDFSSAKIVRSRDPEVLKDCTVVLDVGGIYDPGMRQLKDMFRTTVPCQALPVCLTPAWSTGPALARGALHSWKMKADAIPVLALRYMLAMKAMTCFAHANSFEPIPCFFYVEQQRFDHHQKGFLEYFPGRVPLQRQRTCAHHSCSSFPLS